MVFALRALRRGQLSMDQWRSPEDIHARARPLDALVVERTDVLVRDEV